MFLFFWFRGKLQEKLTIVNGDYSKMYKKTRSIANRHYSPIIRWVGLE